MFANTKVVKSLNPQLFFKARETIPRNFPRWSDESLATDPLLLNSRGEPRQGRRVLLGTEHVLHQGRAAQLEVNPKVTLLGAISAAGDR